MARPERIPALRQQEDSPPRIANGGGLLHLLFLPDRANPRFFLWGTSAAASALAACGRPERAPVVDDTLTTRELDGAALPLLEALPRLAAMTSSEIDHAPASLAAWSLAAKLVLDLVGRERIVPRVVPADGGREARFVVALTLAEDAERVSALAKAFPAAAHAVPVPSGTGTASGRRRSARTKASFDGGEVWAPEALLRAFLDAAADTLVRAAAGADMSAVAAAGAADTLARAAARCCAPARRAAGTSRRTSGDRGKAAHVPWERRLVAALTGAEAAFAPQGFTERGLLSELEGWARPALGAEAGAPRVCFRLDLPDSVRAEPARRARPPDAFPLSFFLQAADDPSLLVPASEVFRGRGQALRRLGHSFQAAEEHLLRNLAAGARLFPPIERGLREARPAAVLLEPNEAWAFLGDAAPALVESGMGVILPAELTRSGQRRLRLRMRIGGGAKAAAGTVAGATGLSLDEVMSFRWEVSLAGETLSERDLLALARLKAPLVRFRGQWVAVDRAEIDEARQLLAAGGGTLAAHEALAAALGETARGGGGGLPVEVAAEGRLAAVVARLRKGGAARGATVPRAFHGRLRPYQERGLGWLALMSDLGLGACLADDMGLGKTIEFLAYLLHRRESHPEDRRKAFLACPTSVLGNWEREVTRFAPSLPIVRHYGSDRARSALELESAPPGALVITTYGLLRRDAEILGAVDWSVAVLDEAQNIKNAVSHTARAARSLRAGFRVALTGTPVENRLAELWSISEYLNPRLLGPLETFRREVAAPIERYGRDDVAESLKRVLRPFVLRRLKSDRAIIRDLPAKHEMKVVCTLTREQASLYQAAVDEALRRIESSEGIQRRGLVLALITALKQICNHPAHYLGESGPLPGRSGKLDRLHEMLEEAIAAGDRALVFTQFREMGDRLVAALSRSLGTEVPFLHGGVARAARDAMVRRFQEDPRAPQVFVLSVKAGGTGLNLTAASHVFHFDRWWNPAVEDQATDRAYRIGQRRAVQVHKLVCAGTVEEKVDQMLEKKRDLASRIVGQGERWITELDDAALRDLFSLASDAVVVGEEPGQDDGDAVANLEPRRGRRAEGGEPTPARRRGRGRVLVEAGV